MTTAGARRRAATPWPRARFSNTSREGGMLGHAISAAQALAPAAAPGSAGVFVAPLAHAQGLSSRPIRVILGQTAATTPDLIARLTAQRLQARWNQPVIVENRGGAGGAIGLDAVAKARAQRR